MDDRLTQTSKFLSYVLRHNPGALALNLDPGGWADVDTLIERARADGRSLSRSRLRHVLDAGDKTRFSLSEDGSKIRANYGHSIDVDLDVEPTPPTGSLYHGTARHALSAIREEGLTPQSRQYVHLSSTREAATAVGQRHGPPVVLPIDAPALHEAGYTLYRSTDTVWLTRHVPPPFITFPDPASSAHGDDES
jgi:putative RNA 2'-phosphotransferase